jgi:hypothetical protein
VTVEVTERDEPEPCDTAECRGACAVDGGNARDGGSALDGGSADAGRPDGAEPDAGVPPCDETMPARCEGEVRVVCVGGRELRQSCPVACVAGEGRCAPFEPSNVRDGTDWWGADAGFVLDTEALGADADTAVVVHSDTGELCLVDDGETACQGAIMRPPYVRLERQFSSPGTELSGSEPVGVFVFREIRVARGTRLYFVEDWRDPSTPAVILVAGDVRIDGEVRAAACQRLPCNHRLTGAGAHRGASPGEAGQGPGGGQPGTGLGDPDGSGGGGGSYGGSGGPGGDGAADGSLAGGAAGTTYGSTEISPLIGGSGGGAGVPGLSDGGDGAGSGWGGGALQISARGHIVVGVDGIVDVSGEGGYPGRDQNGDSAQGTGSGGGSGGAILLEAPYVLVRGSVTANGGGGSGAYCEGTSVEQRSGSSGGWEAIPAPGAPLADGCDDRGAGGPGNGQRGEPAGAGESEGRAGGGGGGAGRIRVNTGPDGWLLEEGSLVSPAPDPSPCPTLSSTDYLATCGSL